MFVCLLVYLLFHNMFILFVCLFLCLCACFFLVCLFICLFVCLIAIDWLIVCLLACLFVCLLVCFLVCLFYFLLVSQSVCLLFCLFVCLFLRWCGCRCCRGKGKGKGRVFTIFLRSKNDHIRKGRRPQCFVGSELYPARYDKVSYIYYHLLMILLQHCGPHGWYLASNLVNRQSIFCLRILTGSGGLLTMSSLSEILSWELRTFVSFSLEL